MVWLIGFCSLLEALLSILISLLDLEDKSLKTCFFFGMLLIDGLFSLQTYVVCVLRANAGRVFQSSFNIMFLVSVH